jgi:spore germination cell wall hydrolase CwlJ-like protein
MVGINNVDNFVLSAKENIMEKFIKATGLALVLLLAVVLVKGTVNHKFDQLRQAQGLRNLNVMTAKERERQLDCLAINIYREAGYEPFEGKVAVAQVTMNRAEHPQFPNDVCAVVYQKTTAIKTVCQFSWYCDATHRARPVNSATYAESYEVAKRVLLEGFRLPGLKDALFYHADYVNPRWRLDRITQIGAHIFYRHPVKER